jgi:hypothetical protein
MCLSRKGQIDRLSSKPRPREGVISVAKRARGSIVRKRNCVSHSTLPDGPEEKAPPERGKSLGGTTFPGARGWL